MVQKARQGSGRKRGRPTHEEVAERLERDPAKDIEETLDELGAADATLRLMRQRLTTPRLYQHLAMIPLTHDLIEEVASQFGGGDYKAHVHSGPESVRGRTITFSVAGKPKNSEEESAQADPRLATLEQEIRQLREKAQDNGVERTVNMITGITAALAPIVTPLLENMGSNKGGNVAEVLTLVQTAEAKGEARGRELGKLLAGGGGESMADVARAYLPPILSLMDKRANPSNQAPVIPVPQLPAATPVTPPPAREAVAPPPPAGYEWLAVVRPVFPRLMQQAQNNVDAELVAEFAFSQMDAPMERAIAECSKRDDFRATLRSELGPIFEQYPQWSDDFITAVIAQATPEEPATPIATARSSRKRA